MAKGYVSEIFSTLQGEGPFLGERQIFIRTAGCPWRCRYCDTPGSLSAAGHRAMSVEEVLDEVHHLQEERAHKTASLTGGEPLAQADFLAELLPALKRLDLRTYLETSGTLPGPLRRVADACDVVSMDIKFASAIGRDFWTEHAESLKIAGGKAFVKIVLTAGTTEEEFTRAVDCLAAADPVPLLVLQPATPIEDLEARLSGGAASGPMVTPPPAQRIVHWWEWARQKLPEVRLIPQMHPQWGLP